MFILNLLATALVIFLCAKFMPGVTVKNFWWAIVVALVIAGLNVLVGFLMSFIHLGDFSNGLLGFVIGLIIDTCVLMLADRIVDNFKIQNWKLAMAIAAVSMLVSTVIPLIIDQT